MQPFKIGILREEKIPTDHRTPLTPAHCAALLTAYPHAQIHVQPAAHRCYTHTQYEQAGCTIQENLHDCDILIGVKEVPIDNLVANNNYIFFTHTAKQQLHNKKLLQSFLQKKITAIDYEYLTDPQGVRTVAFGRFAGVVGAHNALLMWGARTGKYTLTPAHQCTDYATMREQYAHTDFGNAKIVVTGNGRVAKGAIELLKYANIMEVNATDFFENSYAHAVFTQTHTPQIYQRKTDGKYDRTQFFEQPHLYQSAFAPYTQAADILINCMYWNAQSPRLFELEAMAQPNFNIKSIADVSCDINGSVPATHRATTIHQPTFGYQPHTRTETPPYQPQSIDIMAVDNLPCELPQSASEEFSDQLMQHFIPALLDSSGLDADTIRRATITQNGTLTPPFVYLQTFVNAE
jgi:alanine dehydrogenase